MLITRGTFITPPPESVLGFAGSEAWKSNDRGDVVGNYEGLGFLVRGSDGEMTRMDRKDWLPFLRFFGAARGSNPFLQLLIISNYVNYGHFPRSSGSL